MAYLNHGGSLKAHTCRSSIRTEVSKTVIDLLELENNINEKLLDACYQQLQPTEYN